MDEIYLSVGKFAERLTYLLDNDSPQCYDGFKGEENMEETIARVAGNSIPQIERFIVESEEKKGVKYTVDVWTAIGQAACSCMDFIARKGPAGLPCKHIRAVLGQDNAPELTIHPADAYWITSMKPL